MISIILNNYYEKEIEELIIPIGIKKFRADQIFRYIHKQNIFEIDDFNLISKKERDILKEKYKINKIKILEVFNSKLDETKKILYLLEDKHIIEGVLMSYKHGYSLCVSTQVGCRMGCSFCASTVNGRSRNLEVSEIISQIYVVENYFNIKISNIVLMGSGEPFDNYDNVIKALNILNDEKGRNLSMRNITLSTCGLADKIIKFANDNKQSNLAVSIHSFKNDVRSKMMPINTKFDIDTLMNAIREYTNMTNNRISIEYTVIPGENDSESDIILFKKYLKNINYIVNLIALNPINEYNEINYHNKAKDFYNKLINNNINVTLRRELGSDISASCGQLIKSYLEEGGSCEI